MSVHALRASSGDARLLAAFRAGAANGRVHSVFARAVNVEAHDGTLWTLACRALGDGPGALVVEAASFGRLAIGAGEVVGVDRDAVALGDDLRVAFRGARAWDCILPRWPADASALVRNAERAREALDTRGTREPALADALVSQRLGEVHDALAAGDADAYVGAATALLGLGPGLTPSGDDALAGLFAALHVGDAPGAALRPSGARIAALARTRTTAVAAAMLCEAARGRVREPVAALLRALLERGPGDVSHALDDVLAIGASSGADLAAGVLAGVHAQLRSAATAAAP